MTAARSSWLLRVLVPSWRFFEAEDARFLLEARVISPGEAPSAFKPAVPAVARGVWSCVFAPEHNLRLFCHDAIERFVQELGERGALRVEEVETLASYARVRELVRCLLRDERAAGSDASFQLRLSTSSEADERGEELFLSQSYPIAS